MPACAVKPDSHKHCTNFPTTRCLEFVCRSHSLFMTSTMLICCVTVVYLYSLHCTDKQLANKRRSFSKRICIETNNILVGFAEDCNYTSRLIWLPTVYFTQCFNSYYSYHVLSSTSSLNPAHNRMLL